MAIFESKLRLYHSTSSHGTLKSKSYTTSKILRYTDCFVSEIKNTGSNLEILILTGRIINEGEVFAMPEVDLENRDPNDINNHVQVGVDIPYILQIECTNIPKMDIKPESKCL